MGRRGFTAIELAVVLVIITILAMMLLPALEEGRTRAIETKCLARVRQVGLACTMYQTAFGGLWPWGRRSVRPDHPEWPDPTASLAALYPSYVTQTYLFECPATDDVVSIDVRARDFLHCSNFYVSPSGRATRPDEAGKGAPCPPSFFYDAGFGGPPGIPENSAPSRVTYGDQCVRGVWKGQRRDYWLGRDNHKGGGNFLFVDKHVAWLPQQWEGVPRRLGRGVPFVPNPSVQAHGPGEPAGALLDHNVFADDSNGGRRAEDAYLSGMMWIEDSWKEF